MHTSNKNDRPRDKAALPNDFRKLTKSGNRWAIPN